MPEGHSIHRLSRAFDELFGGQRLSASSPQGRFTRGAEILDGLKLTASEAFGKQLFLGFGGAAKEPAHWLRVHLGLYGAWTFAGDRNFHGPHAIGAPRRRVGEEEKALPPDATVGPSGGQTDPPDSADERFVPPAPRGAVRLRLLGDHGCADLNGPTACEVITETEMAGVLARLGPDPLRSDSDPERFIQKSRARRVAIGSLLMDQAVLAGVGNIYRAESLFRAGVDPYTPGSKLPGDVLNSIWQDLRVLMADGVAQGKIVIRPDPEEPFFVYRRTGMGCFVCGSPIAEAKLQARRLFWCPGCQS
ncbi:Fpg/Nei family DNA glycosylase [Saxibacter everestensis]|uniref:DNA-(apurinic or apyrimidinic site) lyase n=1 Tax=Saxibacter everestensis TaxID=2909229 RepID=A0ABY8QYC7_9MICO|nr:Fpg/Nei family DNA glycosylase [Brevibacteriaceae bacterium ZFBP1038]